MTTMTDNEQRASRGWDAIYAYAARHDLDTSNDDDHEAAAVDLMTDLLHAIERFTGWDTEAIQRKAWRHFQAEKAEEESAR